MEKIDAKQQNQLADDELEQVSGGSFIGVFTTEFREFFNGFDDQGNPLVPEEEDIGYGVGTLEMRVKPKKKGRRKNTGVVKL